MTVCSSRCLCLALSLLLQSVLIQAKPGYRAYIPNAFNVPGVKAIGHSDVKGGGPLNAFGQAWQKAGEEWTKELCEADSDGDGLTNGQELGDPCCQWTAKTNNSAVLRTTDLTNPGDPDSVSKTGTCSAGSMTGSNSTVNKSRQATTQPNKSSGASSVSWFHAAVVGLGWCAMAALVV